MKFAAVKLIELFHVKTAFSKVMMLHSALVITAIKGFKIKSPVTYV